MEKDGALETSQSTSADLDPLGHAIQELGKTVPPIPLILHDPLQQTAHTMKQAIRRILQTNIKLYTHLQYSEGTTQLFITIHNKSTLAIPVKVSMATLDFKSVSHASDPTATEPQPKLPSAAPLTSNDASLFLPPSSIVLHPTCQHTEVLSVTTYATQQYNGHIQIQVLPVDYPTLEPVSITHSFGIYLIDQMKKSVVHLPQQQEEGHEWTYQGRFLREMFDMDPMTALEQGMFVCLESSDGTEIVCRIDEVDDDSVKVCFFGENKSLIRSLVHELDSLDV